CREVCERPALWFFQIIWLEAKRARHMLHRSVAHLHRIAGEFGSRSPRDAKSEMAHAKAVPIAHARAGQFINYRRFGELPEHRKRRAISATTGDVLLFSGDQLD